MVMTMTMKMTTMMMMVVVIMIDSDEETLGKREFRKNESSSEGTEEVGKM